MLDYDQTPQPRSIPVAPGSRKPYSNRGSLFWEVGFGVIGGLTLWMSSGLIETLKDSYLLESFTAFHAGILLLALLPGLFIASIGLIIGGFRRIGNARWESVPGGKGSSAIAVIHTVFFALWTASMLASILIGVLAVSKTAEAQVVENSLGWLYLVLFFFIAIVCLGISTIFAVSSKVLRNKQ